MRGKEEILEHINAFVREYQKGRELTARWKLPLMGFADANSPYIRSVKELISPTHYLPEEFLPELLPRSDGKAVAIALVLP